MYLSSSFFFLIYSVHLRFPTPCPTVRPLTLLFPFGKYDSGISPLFSHCFYLCFFLRLPSFPFSLFLSLFPVPSSLYLSPFISPYVSFYFFLLSLLFPLSFLSFSTFDFDPIILSNQVLVCIVFSFFPFHLWLPFFFPFLSLLSSLVSFLFLMPIFWLYALISVFVPTSPSLPVSLSLFSTPPNTTYSTPPSSPLLLPLFSCLNFLKGLLCACMSLFDVLFTAFT